LIKVLPLVAFSVLLLTSAGFQNAYAVTTFFGPSPYLSSADIPAGIFAGIPTIEDFEDDDIFDTGIIGSTTGVILAPPSAVDSVDADDGVIDGNCTPDCRSLRNSGESMAVTVTFTSPFTAVGIVMTDVIQNSDVTVEAFGPGLVSLGTHGPFVLGGVGVSGATAEDRFFGFTDPNGILQIRITTSVNGIETDHVMAGTMAGAVVIGGELLPIDSTALILANTQSFSWMIPVVLSVLGIGLFVVSRKSDSS